jgi:hypothetical protein
MRIAAFLLVTFAATAQAAPTDLPPGTCVSARVRVTQADHRTQILEATPAASSFVKADELALAQCAAQFPDSTCSVAGHLIVDCPE